MASNVEASWWRVSDRRRGGTNNTAVNVAGRRTNAKVSDKITPAS